MPVIDWADASDGTIATNAAASKTRIATAARLNSRIVNLLDCNEAPDAVRRDLVAGRGAKSYTRAIAWRQNVDDRIDIATLDTRLKLLLPEEYRDSYEAMQPKPMGSAPLKYDADGHVAWDQIWGSFCDLAMAGGPPH